MAIGPNMAFFVRVKMSALERQANLDIDKVSTHFGGWIFGDSRTISRYSQVVPNSALMLQIIIIIIKINFEQIMDNAYKQTM